MPRTKRNVAPVKKGARKGAARRLLNYVFKYYKWQFLAVAILVLLNAFCTAVGSYFIGNIVVDEFVLNANQEIRTMEEFMDVTFLGLHFYECIIVMAVIYVVGLFSLYFYNFLMAGIGQGVQKRIRDSLFEKMEELPVSYFDSRTNGDIMSIYSNDVDTLREMLSRALPMAVSALVTMIIYFFIMIFTDVYMTLVVLAFAVVIVLISKYYTKMSAKHFITQQKALGKTNGYIEENTAGQRVIKVFNHEEANVEGFDKLNEELRIAGTKANRYANVLMPTVNQLGNLQYVLLGLLGGLASYYGASSISVLGTHQMTVGIVVSFLLYSKGFSQPIGQIGQQLNTVALALAGASRIFDMMDEKPEEDNGYVELVNAKADEKGNPVECKEFTGKWAWKHTHTDGSGTEYKWLEGDIQMEDVNFGYVPEKIVLHDINLYAKPGQKVAFVGATGAGKTTITNLLTRFYDIQSGKIRYDGINITKIKKADLRRSLGMVLQDTKLFTGTVRENIRFGNLHATDEEVEAAAKLANADSFIRLLPNGYDTMLTAGGASLSQGQRQLLAIARAAVANPPVLILDEATSSIDSRTEKLVQDGMDAIMKGRTIFVIAHRLSTIQNADVIMVLENGRIIERGNHESLLEKKGVYYNLYTGSKKDLD